MEVDVALDLVAELLDLDASGRRVVDEADGVAEPEGLKHQLHRVRPRIRAEQHRRLVADELERGGPLGGRRAGVLELLNLAAVAAAGLPCAAGAERQLPDLSVVLDRANRGHEAVDVYPIADGDRCHLRPPVLAPPGGPAGYDAVRKALTTGGASTFPKTGRGIICAQPSSEPERAMSANPRHEGDRHDAEDLVQETLLRAVRARSALRDPGRTKAWL